MGMGMEADQHRSGDERVETGEQAVAVGRELGIVVAAGLVRRAREREVYMLSDATHS